MKKGLEKLIALLLCSCMLCGALAACNNGSVSTDETTNDETTVGNTDETTSGDETTEEETSFVLTDGEYASLIQNAHELKNGVNVYYADPSRNQYVVTNNNMQLEYMLNAESPKLLTALKSASGKTYLGNTMDVYVKMTDGRIFYASETNNKARVNVLKLGYYY